MNKIFYITLAGVLFYGCASQKNATKVHAYRQPVLQGANPRTISDEQGKAVERTMIERAQFFIYVESPTSNIEVKELWIKGKPYAAKTEAVASTPVVMMTTIRPNAVPDTLVKPTSNKVWMVTPREPADVREIPASLQKKISGNELVVHCVVNGKHRYYTQASIKNLPPLALQ